MAAEFALAMAGAAAAHQAAAASREGNGQQTAGRTRRTSADPQRAQQGAIAAAPAAPTALDSLSRLQQLANASPQVAQLRRLQALVDARFTPVAQLAGGPEEEELVHGKFGTAQLQPQRQQAPRANNTGLPDQLKSGIESLSGLSMDDVRVHYNSSQPAQLNALAYAQGSDIHLAPGQEHHLPHEAWHVVQQAQGRVRPTLQMKEGVPVNDDIGLEREADVMGSKALDRGHRVVEAHRSVSLPIETAQPIDGDATNSLGVNVANNHSAPLANGRGSAQRGGNELQRIADHRPEAALQRQVQAWGDGSERVGQLRAWQGVADGRGVGVKRQDLSPNFAINDDPSLEREADTMGAKALQMRPQNDRPPTEIKVPTTAANAHAEPPAPGTPLRSAQFRWLFQLTADGRIVQRKIHFTTPPQGLGNSLDVEQVLERLHPLIRHESLSPTVRGFIADILDDFDEDDREFDDLADLAVAVDQEVRAEDPEQRILIRDEDAEVILDPKFQALIQGVDLPALKQRQLASEINAQAKWMSDVYTDLYARVRARAMSPEEILQWFTQQTREFAVGIIKAARNAFGLPTAPLTILMAGSGARQEMFPGSDLDLAAVTETQNQQEIVEVFQFMQRVVKILQITIASVSRTMRGDNEEIGLGPDTGVYGFRNTPESLAEKALGMQNTGQDAASLASTSAGTAAKLGLRFFEKRKELGGEKHGLSSLGEILSEFGPPRNVAGRMNIKRDFLRMPTLALRDLSQVCNLPSSSSFGRVRDLVRMGFLDGSTGSQVIQALNVISGIRLQCHVHYGKETDTFAATDGDKTSSDDYVLTSQELANLKVAAGHLAAFWELLRVYQSKRTKMAWGPLTGNKI